MLHIPSIMYKVKKLREKFVIHVTHNKPVVAKYFLLMT